MMYQALRPITYQFYGYTLWETLGNYMNGPHTKISPPTYTGSMLTAIVRRK